MKSPLVVRAAGRTFGLTMTPEEVGSLQGLSDEAVRTQCRQGVLPTMPRVDLPGASWRIPTCRLMEQLGIPFEIAPAGSPTFNPHTAAGDDDDPAGLDGRTPPPSTDTRPAGSSLKEAVA